MNGVPDFAIYRPGASSAENDARRQPVRAVIVHTTQGPDSRGIGQSRRHSSPGTFNFLVRDEGVYCFYPADVRCSHAAGSNHAGPGIENEGYTGQPLTPNQVAHLGQLAHWLHDTYGVPLTYATGDPRVWLDNTSDRGFFAHRKIAYPPDASLQHYDEITPAEWVTAIGSTPSGDDMADFVTGPGPFGTYWHCAGVQRKLITKATHDLVVYTKGESRPWADAYADLYEDTSVVPALIRQVYKLLTGWLLKAVPALWRTRGGTPPAV